jgi:arylsulfatase A-like enzyme
MMSSLTRRQFLQASMASAATMAAASFPGCLRATDKPPANVLFIAFDDLNAWINCLGVYPGTVLTPNIDALAASGTLFTNAHCAIPLCNASRISTLTGLSPLQTGVFGNGTLWRDQPGMSAIKTLPNIFRTHGYRAIGSGKIFHHHDKVSWDDYWPNNANGFPDEPVKPNNERPRKGGPPQYRLDATFDWSATDTPVEKMPDYQVADWIIKQFQQAKPHTTTSKPLFIGYGLGKPHLPWYLPKHYFDLYPLDSVQLPAILQNDLDDVPAAGRALVNEYLHKDIVRQGFWKQAVQAYLASMTFADEQLGRVLQALKQSALADNTVIVLWSDHGWHLGEKLQWRKLTLWEEATHIPLIVSGLGVQAGKRCAASVSSLDIAPTLLEMAGIPAAAHMVGHSFKTLLTGEQQHWPHPAITTWQSGNHALRNDRFRYIRYADGSEELYDHHNDPNEWHNLAREEKHQIARNELAKQLEQALLYQSKAL